MRERKSRLTNETASEPGEVSSILSDIRAVSPERAPELYPPLIRLSAAAEGYLSQLAADLELGRCDFRQLSPALRELYTFGYEAGRESLAGIVVNLNAECDRLYLRAYNTPAQIAEIHQRRLDVAFEAEAERLFGVNA